MVFEGLEGVLGGGLEVQGGYREAQGGAGIVMVLTRMWEV